MRISEMIRRDAEMKRPEFSKTYNVPVRTLENWDSGASEAPEYVLDLLARAVWEDKEGCMINFCVIVSKGVDEWEMYKGKSYIKAIDTARDEDKDGYEVEIRVLPADMTDEDIIDSWNTIEFKEEEEMKERIW